MSAKSLVRYLLPIQTQTQYSPEQMPHDDLLMSNDAWCDSMHEPLMRHINHYSTAIIVGKGGISNTSDNTTLAVTYHPTQLPHRWKSFRYSSSSLVTHWIHPNRGIEHGIGKLLPFKRANLPFFFARKLLHSILESLEVTSLSDYNYRWTCPPQKKNTTKKQKKTVCNSQVPFRSQTLHFDP